MSKNQVKKIVRLYARELRRRDFPFTNIFLYGSFAKNRAHPGSDIDVCVVSSVFAGKKWDAFERKLWHWRRAIDQRIEPVGLALLDLKELVASGS